MDLNPPANTIDAGLPLVAVNITIVPLIGWFASGERITPVFRLGVTLILAGSSLTQFE